MVQRVVVINVVFFIQIMVPSKGRGDWCLYVWDTLLKKIHVLDPVHTGFGGDDLWKIHHPFVDNICYKQDYCKEEMFSGWDVDFSSFEDQYLLMDHAPAAG
jgi:hypothetical protein